MSWSRKPLALLAVIAIGSSLLEAKAEDAVKEPAKAEKKKGKGKESGEGKSGKGDAEASGEKNPSKLSVPVPPGHDAKGLVIPMRNEAGQMQMRFTMQVGRRTDTDHLEMTTLLIETFDEEGNEEMSINLPQSRLDLNTRVITTEKGVLIKRSDFEITGQSMTFNTETKAGHLGGKVRMLIYNLENETNSKPQENSRAK